MKPSNSSDPDHFHRVVDCQWGCPAHTDVPRYIRQIAQGDFTGAYLENRKSNVFPGVLGRVCDRPCEPACRRGRLDEAPVAICRLKRVAADLSDDIRDKLPPRGPSNGKRIACVGAGCASLTVANDLLPLGYDITIFEQHDKPGGLMRTNIPSFRLPADVLDDEIDLIVERGVDLRLNSPVNSMKKLLDEGYDAVFVGTGAPRGKDLDIPGRHDSDRIHIGIDWLESVAFEHTDKIGENVLIIGVGNTAMDCCRSSRRLGGKNVSVIARKPRGWFKASAWELDDAEEEDVDILINHSPKNFVVENGVLKGMTFDKLHHKYCNGEDIADRPPRGMNLLSTKMGIHEWSYSNDFDNSERRQMRHVELTERFKNIRIEVELGFDPEQTAREVERCLNCDVQTVFSEKLCIECDACMDVCPVYCLTITDNGDEDDLRSRLRAPADNKDQLLYVSDALPQTGKVMVKDENLCIHCGLCAERCPTGAWDMRKSQILIPYATQ